MKRLAIILTLAGICLSGTVSRAQDYQAPEVKVSTEKVSVGGLVYIVHKVEEKQTAYSISKAYGVTVEQLQEANPVLRVEGLKAGSLLMIPTGQKALSAADMPYEEDEDVSGNEEKFTGDEVVQHRVKWYETIKVISARYRVPAERILEYNEVSSIKKGMTLYIPMHLRTEIQQNETAVPLVVQDETDGQAPAEETVEEVTSSSASFNASSPLKITMILPLKAGSDAPSANYFDFYSGALMALEESKRDGRFIELNVHDLSAVRDAGEITGLSSFRASDIIIGPADASAIEPFAAAAKEFRIPFVSPMDQKADKYLEDNEYFFQVPASAEIQMENMIRHLEYAPGDRVMLFYNSSMSEAQYVNSLKEILDVSGIKYKEVSYDILNGRTIVESVKESLSLTSVNKVIVASEVEAFASDVVRNMKVLSLPPEKYPIQVYCSNRLRNFDTIDTDTFYEVSAHISAPYYVDYSDAATKDFILRYRAMFNAEPTPYSYQGHDITAFFVEALHNFGKDIVRYADRLGARLLQCDIRFEQTSEGSGWYNAATRDIVYDSETFKIILSDVKDQY